MRTAQYTGGGSARYEENDSDRPFVLVVLFTDEKYDPDNRMLTPKPPSRLVRKNLADCLKKLGKKAGTLTVLKPLGLSDIKKNREKLPELVPQWEEEIRSSDLSEPETRELTELLVYAVVQRFQKLTLEEVKKMMQLTPLDQTVAGQELIQMGREEGILIGNIRMAQRFLKRRLTPEKKLLEKSTDELRAMLKKLESGLSI